MGTLSGAEGVAAVVLLGGLVPLEMNLAFILQAAGTLGLFPVFSLLVFCALPPFLLGLVLLALQSDKKHLAQRSLA